jgi:hypothetical protein
VTEPGDTDDIGRMPVEPLMPVDGAGLEILDRAACLQLLARGGVGRIGINVGALPRVLPVRFALDDDRVVLSVGTDTALDRATCDAVVGFETDGTEPESDRFWSVSLIGLCRRLSEPAELARADALALPSWLTGRPHRFVSVSTEHLSGRRSVAGA